MTDPGTIRLAVGNGFLFAEAAVTRQARRRGLEGRRHLAADAAMLFPLSRIGRVTLRRERLRLSLDAALLDVDGRILEIVSLDDSPEMLEPPIDGVSFVIEALRGAFAERGAGVGSLVTYDDGRSLGLLFPRPSPHDAAIRRVAEELLLEALAAGSPTSLVVSGGCMEPLLEEGDRVEVRPMPFVVRDGQILLARGGSGALVCHRQIESEPGRVRLAGDRSSVELLGSEALFGVVVAAERGGRRIELPGPHASLLATLRRRRERRLPGGKLYWLAFRLLFRIAGRLAWVLARPASASGR